MNAQFLEPLRAVVTCLERLSVQFFVGGSFASTLHGEIRTTQDADLILELDEPSIPDLLRGLSEHFFVDAQNVRDAVVRRSSCHLIHRTTGFKVDLFVRKERAFSRSEMSRRILVQLGDLTVPMATAEDCVLAKLEWYEKGGQVSERQWRDVLGVLRATAAHVDVSYLRIWARELGVTGHLERALREAGLSN